MSCDKKGAGKAGKAKPKTPVKKTKTKCPLAGKTFGKRIKIEGDEEFRKETIKALDELQKTPTGKALLESINKGGKTVTIKPTSGDPRCDYTSPNDRFKTPEGKKGKGTDSTVYFDPKTTNFGTDPWFKDIPPGIQIGHELMHAEQAGRGDTTKGQSDNDDAKDPSDPNTKLKANTRELETVGVPPHDTRPFTENKLRSEWDPKQPERTKY